MSTTVGTRAAPGLRVNGGFFIFRREIFDYLNEGEDLVMDGCIRAARAGRMRSRKAGWSRIRK